MAPRLHWLRWVVASVAAAACAVAVAAFEAALTVCLMIEGRKQQSASNPRAGDRPQLILGVCTSDGSTVSFESAVRAVWTGKAAAADFEVSAEVT